MNVRLSHDKEALKQLPEAIELVSVFKDIKLVRLGKPDKEKLRPLKVILPSTRSSQDHHARMFMEMFSRDPVGDNDILLNVSVSRDQSLQERKQLYSLIAELAERSKSGEMNLTIKY